MRQITAWVTKDGKLFTDEAEADRHSRKLNIINTFTDWYYDLGDDRLYTRNGFVTADDFLNWYFEHENELRDILLATGDENENR